MTDEEREGIYTEMNNQINMFRAVKVALEKQIPLKLEYKNGFAHCKCGCEFESEGYQGEEFCSECGQRVWVGGYNGEINNVVKFK